MEDRFINILNLLSQSSMAMVFRDSPYIITGFKKTAEGAPDWYKFQLERDFTPFKYMPDSPFTNLEKRDELLLMLRSERLRVKFDNFGISCLQRRQIDL
jgi:hypothetical protein